MTQPGVGQAAPGAAFPFFPYSPNRKNPSQNNVLVNSQTESGILSESDATARMPWILLDGDGSQCAYQLKPLSPWKYSVTTIINAQATVGEIAFKDIDGDGYVEFFVPAYDTGVVYAFTYGPQK